MWLVIAPPSFGGEDYKVNDTCEVSGRLDWAQLNPAQVIAVFQLLLLPILLLTTINNTTWFYSSETAFGYVSADLDDL